MAAPVFQKLDEGSARASVAEIATIRDILKECRLSKGRGGEIEIEAPIAAGARVSWRLRSPIFRRWIAGKIHARGLAPIGNDALDAILDLLEAAARQDTLSLRGGGA